MHNQQSKKVYTLEDNVKFIAFKLKDLLKTMEEINTSLHLMLLQKSGDENDVGF